MNDDFVQPPSSPSPYMQPPPAAGQTPLSPPPPGWQTPVQPPQPDWQTPVQPPPPVVPGAPPPLQPPVYEQAPFPVPPAYGQASPFAPPPESAMPMPVFAPGQSSYPMPQQAPTPAPKRSKKPLVISLVALGALILIAVGIFAVPEFMRAYSYNQATTLYEQSSFQEAQEAFLKLEDYKDSAYWAMMSGDYVLFVEVKACYDQAKYDEALLLLFRISQKNIPEVAEWIDKCDYAIADDLHAKGEFEDAYLAFIALGDYLDSKEQANKCRYDLADKLYQSGELEEAYLLFTFLGSFSDSADRATACTVPFPASGVLFADTNFSSERCYVDFSYSANTSSYYKIYTGSTLVATLFLNPGSTARVYLTPGTYIIKDGTGYVWFGETLAFGKYGYYSTLVFDDFGTDYFTLTDWEYLELTIGGDIIGNMSTREESLATF